MTEAEDKEKQEGPVKPDSPLVQSQVIDLLVANVIPTTKYFESRFDFLQHQINEVREGQKHLEDSINKRFEQVNAEIKDFKTAVDKRFEQVDKRFEQVDKRFEQVDKRFEQVDKRLEQITASIDRVGDKLDQRDERQRNFTIRMFTIAVSISFLGVLGVLLKIIGIL
jgi:septation ring formation regulator EzrA